MNFYNDNDPKICAWLRELIKQNLIPNGIVDSRSIELIQPDELTPYTQCHFFAGIAGWSYALQLAGWPDTEPVWTGSCPCQPLSCAGQRKGHADQRHLWPAFYNLIAKCKPADESPRKGAGVSLRDGENIIIASIGFPLACSVPNRVGLLRGAGNAIVPQVAAEFIGAYLDVMNSNPLGRKETEGEPFPLTR